MTQLLIFRPLRRAPLVAKIIASLGLLALFQSLLIQHFGRDSRSESPLFPATQIHMGGLSFPEDRLWIAGLALVLAAAVTLVYRRTLLGLATRALLEDEAALTLSRWSPGRLAVANVAGGIMLTTAVMIVGASISPLDPTSVGLLVVPGLTAMLVGRLVNVLPAALFGLLLGMTQGELSFLTTKAWWPTWISSGGVTDAVPLIVIILVLVLRGRSLPSRAGLESESLPRVPPAMRLRTIGGIGVVVVLGAPFFAPALRLGLATSMAFAVLALSLVVIVGMIGQISLGQLAIAGIAAEVLVRYTASWPFPTGLIVASVMAAVMAVVIGSPALRVRGAQLAVLTLAGAAAVQSLVLNNAESSGTGADVASPTIGPLDLSSQVGAHTGRLQFVYAVLVLLLLSCAGTSMLIRGSLGRRFLAVRGNEQASASIGIGVARTKMLALGIAGFLAGVGGCLLAYVDQTVSASAFGVFLGVILLVYAYIGGITGVGGALYAGAIAPGGILFVWVSEHWTIGPQYDTVAAIGLILIAVLHPHGFADAMRVVLQAARRRFGRELSRGSALTLPSAHLEPPAPARLVVRGVTVRYGGVIAVDDVSLEVAPGEIVGLIGPNGAGKTSLLDALTGFTRANGSVALGERMLTGLAPHRRYAAGLGRTWQTGQLFEDLTVFDNARVARPTRANAGSPRRTSDADAASAMRLLGICDLAAKRPGEITGGQRKLVGVARALAGRPSVLLADEPAAGLDTFESRQLGEHLIAVAKSGVGVLLIEHDLALVLSICDRIYVLDRARLIASGTPDQIRQDPAVVRAYIGESQDAYEEASWRMRSNSTT